MATLLTGLTSGVVFVIMLGILVVVHEWGHFIVARLFKIRVDEFSLGFGPRAARICKRGDTEYNIRWVPLGGYVKIAGMEADEEPLLNARDKARELIAGADLNKAEVPLVAENTRDHAEDEEQRRRDAIDGFYAKPRWQRALVIFAGPVMSFLLGVVLLCSFGMTFGLPIRTGSVVESVISGSAAQHMGLKPGDVILKANDKSIPKEDGTMILTVVHGSIGKPVTLTIQRGNQVLSLTGTPRVAKDDSGAPVLDRGKPFGILGFSPGASPILHRVGFTESVGFGLAMTQGWVEQVAGIFHHPASIGQSTGGPIAMVKYNYETFKKGPLSVLELWAGLTMSLAVFNLLPIPVLDGGHILVIAVESLRRGRRLSLQQQQNFMLAGLAVILCLFVAVMSNDIFKLVHGKLHLPQ